MYLIKFCYEMPNDEFGMSGAFVCDETEKNDLMAKIDEMVKFYKMLDEGLFYQSEVTIWCGSVCMYLVGADLMDYFTCEMISVTEAETLLRLMGNDGLHGAPCIGFFPDVETMYDEFLETFDTEEDE